MRKVAKKSTFFGSKPMPDSSHLIEVFGLGQGDIGH